VTTNPRSSRATAPPSQSVRGSAPMKTNTQFVATSTSSPFDRSESVSDSRWPSPRAAVISVRSITSTLPVERTRSAR